jgi:hypothetical protein
MSSPFPLDGGCDCGLVRYRMQTRPLLVHRRKSSTPLLTAEKARRSPAARSVGSPYGVTTRVPVPSFGSFVLAPLMCLITCRPTYTSLRRRSSPGSNFPPTFRQSPNTTTASCYGRRKVSPAVRRYSRLSRPTKRDAPPARVRVVVISS